MKTERGVEQELTGYLKVSLSCWACQSPLAHALCCFDFPRNLLKLNHAWEIDYSSSRTVPRSNKSLSLAINDCSQNTRLTMDQRQKTYARRIFINLAIVIAVLYIITLTFFVVHQHRLAVLQSDRMQRLETVAGELAARVEKMENNGFTAQKTDRNSVGETNRVMEGKSARLKSKVR